MKEDKREYVHWEMIGQEVPLSELVGSPILMADESRGDTGYDEEREGNSHYLWTFYRFATKGAMWICAFWVPAMASTQRK